MKNVMEEKVNIPNWLKSLQENSWELELFISGGAIFTLFQASDNLLHLSNVVKINMILPGHHVILLIAMFGIKLLTLGFVFHLMLRAYWVAMVFINFVYPQGVNSSKVKWKKPFKVDLDERSDLYSPIMAVDKLSGIVMYLSILSSFAIIGFIFLAIVSISITFTGVLPDAASVYLNQIILISICVYVFDLLSFGLIRKIPLVSYIAFPFFKVYDYLSLRFLFHKALMVYSTNIKKLNAILISLAFVCIAIVSSYISVQKTFHWPNVFDKREYRSQMSNNASLYFYEDEREGPKVSIQSKIINDNFIDLKVAYWAVDNIMMEGLDKPDSEKLFSDLFQVRIDDSIYTEVKWFPFYEQSGAYGIEALLPISDLGPGEHTLLLELKDELKDGIKGNRELRASLEIPFWKND